jgi:hypothetical protein
MRATRDFDNYRGPEKPDRLEWAGLPIEYWIDLEVFEGSPLFEILEDLCHRSPERSRQQHIELIATRLAERSRKDEVRFSLVNGETTTEVSISDALAQLRLPGTWIGNYDEYLLVWQKPRTLGARSRENKEGGWQYSETGRLRLFAALAKGGQHGSPPLPPQAARQGAPQNPRSKLPPASLRLPGVAA